MKNRVSLFCFLIIAMTISAQDQTASEEVQVRKTIEALFDAMRAGDSTAVRNCFINEATMHTTFTTKKGKPIIEEGSVDKFCDAVGTPHDEIWDEKIWSYDIKIDDRLASVWTEYTFHVGERQSHCGVNAFLLFKSNDGWKIVNLMDTRRRENCK